MDVLPDLEDIVVGSVALTARALQAAHADLTIVQWRSLILLAREPSPLSIGQLAERLQATSSACSRLVGRLWARGLLYRQRDPGNGRSTLVWIAPAGATLVGEVLDRRAEALRDLEIDAEIRPAIALLADAFRLLG